MLSRVQLCDLMDCSLPGSSVPGISQARILEWVAISYSRGSSLTQGSKPVYLASPTLAGRLLTTAPPLSKNRGILHNHVMLNYAITKGGDFNLINEIVTIKI